RGTNGGHLDGVALDGFLDVGDVAVRVSNGLALDGTVSLGNLALGGGSLLFDGSQTVTGSGVIVLNNARTNTLGSLTGQLVVGAGVTVRAHTGTLLNVVNQGAVEV